MDGPRITPQMIRDMRRKIKVAEDAAWLDQKKDLLVMRLKERLAAMVEAARQQHLERRGE